MPVLVDTGVLLGAIDADDADHVACATVLDRYSGRLLVPTTVLAETAWQLETNIGVEAEAALIDAVIAGEIPIVDMQPADYVRSVELLRQYADMRLGLVDASVVALAERLGVTTIATLDRRDFAVVRPAHCDGFVLVP